VILAQIAVTVGLAALSYLYFGGPRRARQRARRAQLAGEVDKAFSEYVSS
jgi:peptidoglycan/LPS O-acetylase OafA/YrhL